MHRKKKPCTKFTLSFFEHLSSGKYRFSVRSASRRNKLRKKVKRALGPVPVHVWHDKDPTLLTEGI